MTKYIRIRNVSGHDKMIVPRIALEKLGLSTKRDDAETIGRFGSGIKYAPIAALRKGWEWWFVGSDAKGPYRMQYIVEEEDGVDCVWYQYGDGDVKPSSFTVGAGELSWTDPFQIIREPIANAIDGTKTHGGEWSFEIVDGISPANEYTFDVYITASPELMNIVNNIDAYFSFNKTPLSKYGNTTIHRSYDLSLRVFSQNVLVAHKDNMASLFDYEFDSIDLNEERTVKSEWDLGWKIANSIAQLHDSDLVSKVIKSAGVEEMFEWSDTVSSHYDHWTFASDWDSIFKNIYGDNAVIYPVDGFASSVAKNLKLRGMTPVGVATENGYKLLSAAGISCYMDILGEDYEYDIEDDVSKYPVLVEAMSIAKRVEPDIEKYLGRGGVLCGDAAADVKGLTLNKNNPDTCRIVVSVEHLQDGSLSDIVATLIHEFDHASTGIGDGYSDEGVKFRDVADKRIGRMIVENYKPNPFFVVDGVVSCRVSDLPKIGNNLIAVSEHIQMLDCSFIKIGDFVLKATGVDIEHNFAHEHNPHFAQDASVITYPTFVNVEEIEVVN